MWRMYSAHGSCKMEQDGDKSLTQRKRGIVNQGRVPVLTGSNADVTFPDETVIAHSPRARRISCLVYHNYHAKISRRPCYFRSLLKNYGNLS